MLKSDLMSENKRLREEVEKLIKNRMTFKDIQKGLLKVRAKSEYKQASIIMLRKVFIDNNKSTEEF